MCGRFNDHLPKMHGWIDVLGEWSPEAIGVRPSYNVAPSRLVAGFPIKYSEVTPPIAMRWGMVPQWANAFESRYATFNARTESVAEKPTFRNAWKNQQRCIIPMAGYYEWQMIGRQTDELKGAKPTKQPLYITDPEQGCLVTAGLYEHWGDDGQISCTILTKPASPELNAVHPRMPILLDHLTVDRWMSDSNQQLDEWLSDESDVNVVYWPVARAVGNVKNDSSKLIEPTDV